MQVAIGIDIGGTSTKLAVIDRQGKVLGKKIFDTQQKFTEAEFFKALFDGILSLLEELGESYDPVGIGIGAPSCFPKEGTINQAANLPFSEKVEIVRILEGRFGLPVSLMKDGNAAALGEGLFGSAKGMENYIVLTLGTGLGCGVIINNKIVSGNNGQAGELGHAIIKENGRECGCGKKGCLETYVSATGIKRTLFQLLAATNLCSSFRDVPFNALTAKMIYKAAKNGDQLAVRAFEYTGQILGTKLSELVTLFEPEAIFLAGGLAQSGELLFRPVIYHTEKNMLETYRGQVKILPSLLETNEAALLGSASLVWQYQKGKTLFKMPVCN